MEPKFQNSFIPKNAAVSPGIAPPSKPLSVNIFSVLAGILFVLTILVSGGLFVYKGLLVSDIKQANSDLDAARKAFEPEKISELVNVSNAISAADGLLQKHVVLSKLLVLLQELTVKRLRYNSLTYGETNGRLTVSADVEAQSYNALAQQLNILNSNPSIKNATFSDIGLTNNGVIRLKLFTDIDSSLVSYKNFVNSQNTQSIEQSTEITQ